MEIDVPPNQKNRPWVVANAIMIDAGFNHDLRWRAQVWAAKPFECPTCLVPPGFPCHNMSDVKKGLPNIRANKFPHPERVNWQLLVNTLRQKGYQ